MTTAITLSALLFTIALSASLLRLARVKQQALVHELERAEERSAKAAETRAEFVRNLSYELRTPLNSVLGSASLLAFSVDPKDQEIHIRSLKASALELTTFVDNVLKLIEVERGALQLEPVRFSLRSGLQRTFSVLSREAVGNGVSTSLHISEQVPEFFRGDVSRLMQIVMAVSRKAIELCKEQAKISLAVDLISQVNTSVHLKFLIVVDSIQLTENECERLMRKTDVDSVFQMGIENIPSLEFFLAMQLAPLFGGAITAKHSNENTIEFSFDCVLDAQASTGSAQAMSDSISEESQDVGAAQCLSVLLVEDNQLNQLVTKRLLEQFGCSVQAASDAEQAATLFQANLFDLVLMDYEVPGADGLQLTALLRHLETRLDYKTPIIALTAHVTDDARVKCLKAGMNDFLAKPVDKQMLYEKLIEVKNVYGSRPDGESSARAHFFVDTSDKPMC